jgi:hypothetical protein
MLSQLRMLSMSLLLCLSANASPARGQRFDFVGPVVLSAYSESAVMAAMPVPATGDACTAGSDTVGGPPTLDPINPGSTVTGKLVPAAAVGVRVCADGKEVGTGNADATTGKFSIKLAVSVTLGQMIVAQQLGTGNPVTYGVPSAPMPVGGCSYIGKGSVGSAPTVNTPVEADQSVVDGKLAGATGVETIRICVDGAEVATATANKDGSFTRNVGTTLTSGQQIVAQLVMPATDTEPITYGLPSKPVSVGGAETGEYNFGRVRYIFSAGAILSQNAGQFSNTASYLDFSADNVFAMKKRSSSWGKVRSLLEPRQFDGTFEARLTSLPVSACQSGSTSSGSSSASFTSTSTSMGTTTTTVSPTFLASTKAALISVSVFFPYYFNFSSWDYQSRHYALYLAPIAVGGFQTLVQSVQSAAGTTSGTTTTTQPNIQAATSGTFFHYYAYGSRIGLYRFHGSKENNSVSPSEIGYLNVTWGLYENFAYVDPTTGGVSHPFRLGMEGRINVPKVPIFLGFDSNTRPGRLGQGQGDLRFLFGTTFDVGCLLQKLSVIASSAACDNTPTSSATTTTSSTSTTAPGKAAQPNNTPAQ